MEGSRSRGRRLLGHGARRRAHIVEPPSPRARAARRRRRGSPQRGVFRRRYNDPNGEWAADFDLGLRPADFGARNPRRRRSPSPPDGGVGARRLGSPDPDDDPDPVVLAAALPKRSLSRRERMNYDLESSTVIHGGAALWTVPVPSIVLLPVGTGYSERATNFVRVNRLAFKISGYTPTEGSAYQFAVAPYPDSISDLHNTVYFRFAVIYDKQCDGVDPTITYPDVYASGPVWALNQYRLPATTSRYEVLHDATYRWKNGELTTGSVEVVPPVQEPFWVQLGMLSKEEIFIDCDKIVRFKSSGGTVADITSGNVFYMICCAGDDPRIVVTTRVTYSDNL